MSQARPNFVGLLGVNVYIVTIITSTCIIINISDIIKCVGVPRVSLFLSIFLSSVIIIHRVLKSLHWCQEWHGQTTLDSIDADLSLPRMTDDSGAVANQTIRALQV